MESQSETTQTVSALKLPVLKTGDYDLWSMRMEQYLTHTDYALWEVIVNGDAPAIASASAGTEGPIPPKTAEQKLARKNELKAKSTLLLAIPDEHLLDNTSLNFNEKVNTARVNNVTTVRPKAVVSATEGNRENVVKSSACCIWRPTGNVINHTSKDSGSCMLKRFDYVDLQGRLKIAPDFEASRARGFVLRSLELQSFA
ncbi:hypothetical protein Tco_0011195 [Tanacetum coccineum]